MPNRPEPRALTDSERQQRRRSKGKVISGVITDPEAIAVLQRLSTSGYTIMRALELGLRALAKPPR